MEMQTERLCATGEVADWSLQDFREAFPFFSARLLAFVPTAYGRPRGAVRRERPTSFRVAADSDADGELEFWTVELHDPDGGVAAFGHLLHEPTLHLLTPCDGRERTLNAAIGRQFGANGSTSDRLEAFRLFWRLAEPAERGLSLIEMGAACVEAADGDEALKAEVAGYTLAEALTGPSANLLVYARQPGQPGRIVPCLCQAAETWDYFRLTAVLSQTTLTLRDDLEPPPAPLGHRQRRWLGQPNPRLFVTDVDWRDRALEQAAADPATDPLWHHEGLIGDPEAVTRAAWEMKRQRDAERPWKRLLPPEDEHMAKKAKAFVEYLNAAQRDIYIDPQVRHRTEEATRRNVWDVPGPEHRAAFRWPTTARLRSVGFYRGYDLIEVIEHVGGQARKTSLVWAAAEADVPTADRLPERWSVRVPVHGRESIVRSADVLPYLGRHVPLDGTSPTFHRLNAALSALGNFRLGAETAPDYVEFFCEFVHGAGAFHIVSSENDVDWRGFPHRQRELLRQFLIPPRVWPGHRDHPPDPQIESVFVDAVVCYDFAFFRSTFRVFANGIIEMLDDEPILQDVSVRSYAPSPKTHFLLSRFEESIAS